MSIESDLEICVWNLPWEYLWINQSIWTQKENINSKHSIGAKCIMSMEFYLGIFQDKPVYLELFQWNHILEYFGINQSI